MSKLFFAKYLPVEGNELNKGEYWLHPKGVVFPYSETYLKAFNALKTVGKAQKVKLFLCSRDIQVDDEVINLFGHASFNLKGKYIADSDLEDTCYIQTKNGGEQCVKSHWIKVIGEISPEATWVKDGDEFNEYQLWCKNIPFWGNTYIMIQPHAWNEPRPTEKGWSDEIIKIKGPCGHFH